MTMAVIGDVRATQTAVVELDNSAFSLIAAGVRVPTAAVMMGEVMAAPPGIYLGPYDVDAPNTETVRPRMTQVIPATYAAVLVHRDAVDPSTTYRELHGMLEADHMVDACAEALIWLRAACTARGGAGKLAPLPAMAQAFPLLMLPALISDYVAVKIQVDLPGRQGAGGAAAAPNLDPVVAAMHQLAENVGGIAARKEPKGVLDAYRETYTVLQRYCHVATVEELVPLWARLARGSKSEEQSILQQEFTRTCTKNRGLSPDIYCPIVTTALKQMVKSLNFVGHGPDDLSAGCQPFMVTYTNAEDHYSAMDTVMVSNHLDQGTRNASLADIREIREKERVKLPQDLNQVSYTLHRYAVLVHTLFQGPGNANPIVRCMLMLANTFSDRLPHYLGHHQSLRGTPCFDVYAAHVVRSVQMNVYEYLQALQVNNGGDAPSLPAFQDLHRHLQRGSFQLSSEWLPLPRSITVAPSSSASAATTATTRSVGSRAPPPPPQSRDCRRPLPLALLAPPAAWAGRRPLKASMS